MTRRMPQSLAAKRSKCRGGSVRTQKSIWQRRHSWSMPMGNKPMRKDKQCTAHTVHPRLSKNKESQKTTPGSRSFRCSACKRLFNERTGTAFNFLEYPTETVLLVVLWRLRSKRSLRDGAELFLGRGFVFTREAVRDWEARFAPLLADQ